MCFRLVVLFPGMTLVTEPQGRIPGVGIHGTVQRLSLVRAPWHSADCFTSVSSEIAFLKRFISVPFFIFLCWGPNPGPDRHALYIPNPSVVYWLTWSHWSLYNSKLYNFKKDDQILGKSGRWSCVHRTCPTGGRAGRSTLLPVCPHRVRKRKLWSGTWVRSNDRGGETCWLFCIWSCVASLFTGSQHFISGITLKS